MAAKTVADAAACCAACTAAEGCAAWVHRRDPKTKQVSPTLCIVWESFSRLEAVKKPACWDRTELLAEELEQQDGQGPSLHLGWGWTDVRAASSSAAGPATATSAVRRGEGSRGA